MAPRDTLLADLRRLERESRPLEPGIAERRKLRSAVIDSSERFLRSLDTHKSYVETEDKGLGLLDAPVGERGITLTEVIESFERDVVEPGAHPGALGHLAYIPGSGLYHSALADYLAAVSNK